MADPRSFRISWTTLILCLCLGSLVVLPLGQVTAPSAFAMFEIDTENYDPFEPGEAEEDLAFASGLGQITTHSARSRFGTALLDLKSASLASVFPPPRPH